MKYVLDASMLNTVLKVLNSIYHEARFRFENGLHAKVTDDTNVAMIVVDVSKDAFHEYEGDITVGVEIHRIYNITKKLSGNVKISIDGNKLKIVSENFEYNYTLIDPLAMRKESKEPELEFPVKAVVSRKDFISVLKLTSKISDIVSVECHDETLILRAKGDMEEISAELGKADTKVEKEKITSKYNVDYLTKFMNACNSNFVTLQFADNYPIRLTSELYNGVEARYYLAPIIEGE